MSLHVFPRVGHLQEAEVRPEDNDAQGHLSLEKRGRGKEKECISGRGRPVSCISSWMYFWAQILEPSFGLYPQSRMLCLFMGPVPFWTRCTTSGGNELARVSVQSVHAYGSLASGLPRGCSAFFSSVLSCYLLGTPTFSNLRQCPVHARALDMTGGLWERRRQRA